MVEYLLYLFLVGVCFVFSIILRKQLNGYGTYMSILLAIVLIFESFDYIFIDTIYINVLDHLYQPLEFTCLTLVYSVTLNWSWFKAKKWVVITLFWILAAVLTFFVEGVYNLNTLSFIVGSFIVLIYAFAYELQLFTTPPSKENLTRQPFFWINTAHLFFYLGTFFQMGFDAYLHNKSPETSYNLYLINYILNFTVYTLYLAGLTCRMIFK